MKVFSHLRIQVVLLLFVIIWLPSNSFARTVNGLAWSKMTSSEKINYLEGFYDGIIFYEIQILEITEPKTAKSNKYLPYQMQFGQLVKAVDKFYEDYKDIYIEVPEALRIVYMEQTGVPLKEITEYKTGAKRGHEILRDRGLE